MLFKVICRKLKIKSTFEKWSQSNAKNRDSISVLKGYV